MTKIAFSSSIRLSAYFDKLFPIKQKDLDHQKESLEIGFFSDTEESVSSDNEYKLRKYKSREDKNEILRGIIRNSFGGKSKDEIAKKCIIHLRIINELVKANGDINRAVDNINENLANYFEGQNINKDEIQDILYLFQNRRGGLCIGQNLTRTAAKYTQVLVQLMDIYVTEGYAKLNTDEFANIQLALQEADKWYRGNYIKNDQVLTKPEGGLEITLGNKNGTMGKDYQINLELLCSDDNLKTNGKHVTARKRVFSDNSYVIKIIVHLTDRVVKYLGYYCDGIFRKALKYEKFKDSCAESQERISENTFILKLKANGLLNNPAIQGINIPPGCINKIQDGYIEEYLSVSDRFENICLIRWHTKDNPENFEIGIIDDKALISQIAKFENGQWTNITYSELRPSDYSILDPVKVEIKNGEEKRIQKFCDTFNEYSNLFKLEVI